MAPHENDPPQNYPSPPGSDSPLRISRRRLLGGAIGGAGALALGSLLGACEPLPSSGFVDPHRWWSTKHPTGTLDFANWPYYIDRTRDNSHPSLDKFTGATGIDVNYYRPIRDVETFVERIAPALAAGKPTGYDIIVVTNGPQLTRLIRSNWLVVLDRSRLTTFDSYASNLAKDPPWDPGNRYTVPWQSGLTGMAYRPEAVEALGRRPSSIQDLWDPALKGRVGMLRDLMDLGSFGLLAIGVDPATSTQEDWRKASARLADQRDDGILVRHFDQGYLHALQRGDIWLTQAWSGDIFQSNLTGHPELRFVVPEEGAMLWTDNMMIPRHAEHPADAIAYMDFVYRPEVAAMIADWVGYITPVPAAQPLIAHRYHDEAVAQSPLVFPNTAPDAREVTSRFLIYPVFSSDYDERAWFSTFGSVLQSGE